MIKKFLLIVLIFYALLCAACFSSWEGDKGIVIIRIDAGNGKTGNRDVTGWFDGDKKLLRHTITLEGPGPKQTRDNIEYGGSAEFSVIPGLWNISIKVEEAGITNNREYRILIASGFAGVVIKPGQNIVIIPIQPVSVITITNEQFEITFDQISNSGNAIINISNDDFTDGKFIISLKDPEQYGSIEWNCKGIKGSGSSFILDLNNDYYYMELEDSKYFYLMVEVQKGGIPYSKPIIISVNLL